MLLSITFVVIFIFIPNISIAYPSDLKDQIALVFNVLTGKSCNNLYDAANAIYRNQANKYNADITPLTSYEKVKSICKENRFICSEDNDELLFKVGHIADTSDHYKIATIDFYTKNNKHLVTKCNVVVNTNNTNRGYPISLPQISDNLRKCVQTIENKKCVVEALNNIYTTLETSP
ncbi:hypothetical protein JCM8795_12300 [Hydrogenobaculum acidophilum]